MLPHSDNRNELATTRPNPQQPPEKPTGESPEADRTRKRARVRKGTHIHNLLNPNYAIISLSRMMWKKKGMRKSVNFQFFLVSVFTTPTLKTLKGVLTLIYDIGWSIYFDVNVPAYVELVGKFYTTFNFHKLPKFQSPHTESDFLPSDGQMLSPINCPVQ